MATKITGTNTAAAPGVTGDDTDTGLFYGTNEIGFSTGGTSRLTLDSSGYLNVPDNGKIRFGTGDLELYHDASHSYVKHDGTGDFYVLANGSGEDLILQADTDVEIKPGGGETGIKAIKDGAVELYHNNIKIFNTASTGIEIRGPESGNCEFYMYADEGDDNADLWKFVADTGGDFTTQNKASGSWAERLRIGGDGKVHINRTTALDSNHINFSATKALSAGIPQNQINIGDAAAYNTTDNGGAIGFSAIYSSGGAYTTMASIEGVKTNNTDGNYNGDMVFKTRSHNGNNVTRMRLTDAGLCFGTDTAATSALSDYEEGSFDATMDNSVTLHSNYNTCTYTKVGDLVHVSGEIRIDSDNSNSAVRLNNLPFTCHANTEGNNYSVGSVGVYAHDINSGYNWAICKTSPNSTLLHFQVMKNTGNTSPSLAAHNNGYIAFAITYKAA